MDVEVKVCKDCKKLFYAINGQAYCGDCRELREGELKVVKEYIRTHEDAGVQEVAEACEVAPQQILVWVREERIEFKDQSRVMMPCMLCGANISGGSYCDKCKKLIASGMAPKPSEIKTEVSSSNNKSFSKKDYLSVNPNK